MTKSINDRWLNEIDTITDKSIQQFGSIPAEHLNICPSQGQWSIAQNLEHLIVTNETYFPIIEALKSGKYSAPLHGRIGFVVKAMEKEVLKAVNPDRKKKMKTFPIWQPSADLVQPGILDRFRLHQEKLKEVIKTSEKWIGNETVISSPASRIVVYRLGTAFDIIVLHEKRHLAQAEEILSRINHAI